jgi:hypothetical protein
LPRLESNQLSLGYGPNEIPFLHSAELLLVMPFIFERGLRRHSGDRTIFTPTRLRTVVGVGSTSEI